MSHYQRIKLRVLVLPRHLLAIYLWTIINIIILLVCLLMLIPCLLVGFIGSNPFSLFIDFVNEVMGGFSGFHELQKNFKAAKLDVYEKYIKEVSDES